MPEVWSGTPMQVCHITAVNCSHIVADCSRTIIDRSCYIPNFIDNSLASKSAVSTARY